MGLWDTWTDLDMLFRFQDIYNEINDVRAAALDKRILEDLDYELRRV